MYWMDPCSILCKFFVPHPTVPWLKTRYHIILNTCLGSNSSDGIFWPETPKLQGPRVGLVKLWSSISICPLLELPKTYPTSLQTLKNLVSVTIPKTGQGPVSHSWNTANSWETWNDTITHINMVLVAVFLLPPLWTKTIHRKWNLGIIFPNLWLKQIHPNLFHLYQLLRSPVLCWVVSTSNSSLLWAPKRSVSNSWMRASGREEDFLGS